MPCHFPGCQTKPLQPHYRLCFQHYTEHKAGTIRCNPDGTYVSVSSKRLPSSDLGDKIVGNMVFLFMSIPLWLSLSILAIGFSVLFWGWSSTIGTLSDHPVMAVVTQLIRWSACLFGGVGLIFWLMCFWRRRQARQNLESVENPKDLRYLGWREFEELVAEAYRQQKYVVWLGAGMGADGGVDITLKKEGATILVQCKQWKWDWVGVDVVRSLVGVMHVTKARSGIVVASGNFSPDAIAFAKLSNIQLVDGSALLDLLRDVRSKRESVPAETEIDEGPRCPCCDVPLIIRVKRSEAKPFWGCPRRSAGCKGPTHADQLRFPPPVEKPC